MSLYVLRTTDAPAELPSDDVNSLDAYSPELLRHVASYAEELAEYREREDRLAEEDSEDEDKHGMLRSAAEDLGSLERALTNEVSQKCDDEIERRS